jgi:hypothetical protein
MTFLKTLRATALAAAAALCAAGAADAKAPSHIFYIMMENHGFSEIVGNTADAPYINQLASQYAVATNYYGVTHPSLPNYLAAMSGNFQGIWDDCKAGQTITCAPEEFVPGSGDGTDGNYLTHNQVAKATAAPHWFYGSTIVDRLETAGLTWKAYFQSMPAGGYDDEYAPVIGGTTVKLYAQKHNPFMYFAGIRNSPARLANVVPFEANFAADLASGAVPNFVFIAPDQCHDMHGVSPSNAALIGLPTCGYPDSGLDHGAIQLGDAFLQQTVGAIMSSSVWAEGDSAIVITWDEDDYTGFAGCCGSPLGVKGVTLGGSQVPTIVITAHGKPMTFTAPANHYSLLATIESLLGLHCLGKACGIPAKGLMTPMFK